MAQIVDYASLTQAISDFAHRSDLATGLYTDYFIQTAQNQFASDIIENNFGNGIKPMEVSLAPNQIAGGTLPVPSDWVAPKSFQVADGNSDVFPLIFKPAEFIYDAYPVRQPSGIPAYIARDNMAAASFTASISGTNLTVTAVSLGVLQTGMILTGAGVVYGQTITGQTSGTTGGVGVYTISDSQTIASESMTGGGSVFIFGPYPDSQYTVTGTYYSKGLPLSGTNATNWMVLSCPETLHAYCMVEAGKFLKDATMMATWREIAQDFLQSTINQDKGERFAASTMQIETG